MIEEVISLIISILPIVGASISLAINIIQKTPDIIKLIKKKNKPIEKAEFDKIVKINWKKYPESWTKKIENIKLNFKTRKNILEIIRPLIIIYLIIFNIILQIHFLEIIGIEQIKNISLEDIKNTIEQIIFNPNLTNIIINIAGILYLYWLTFLKSKEYKSKIKELEKYIGNEVEVEIISDYIYLINRCIKTLNYLDIKITSIREEKIGELYTYKITSKFINENSKKGEIITTIEEKNTIEKNKKYKSIKIKIKVNEQILEEIFSKTNTKIENIEIYKSLINAEKKAESFINNFIT